MPTGLADHCRDHAQGDLRAAEGIGRVFLEAAPEGIDVDAVGIAMIEQEGMREVHDLHVWEVTSGFPALSAHVLVSHDADCHALRRGIEQVLHDGFEIEHTTLQGDHEGGELLTIG